MKVLDTLVKNSEYKNCVVEQALYVEILNFFKLNLLLRIVKYPNGENSNLSVRNEYLKSISLV